MSDKPQSTEPRPDVSRETPEADLLESILDKSPAEQKDTWNKPAGEEPKDAPETPPEGEDPPSPAPGKGKKAPPANKRTSVYRYLLVLFGAAFILLLLAYFIQQRSSETAISDLRDTMNLSRAELMEEIDALKEEKAALEEQVADLSPLPDELEKLQEEYNKLEEQLQRKEDDLLNSQQDFSTLAAFCVLEQALRDKNYEVAAKKVRSLAQANLTLGIVNLDATEYFYPEERLAEIITLLERRGVLDPGEVTLPGQEQPE